MFVDETIPAIRRSSRARQQSLFSVLECCKSVSNLAKIHTQIVINGFTQKNFILVKLLSLYIAFGFLEKAQKVFEDISVPSTSTWNQMIRAQARSEMPQNSMELFKRMAAAEVEPDGFTYSYLLSACARSRFFREGKQIHGRVLANGYCSNTYIATNLVNLYANGGGGEDFELESARSVFDEMVERNVVAWNSLLVGYVRRDDFDPARKIFDDMPERNVRSWTTMVAGYAQNGKCKQALLLFHAMRRARMELDQVALVAALSACAELGDLKSGTWIHRYIEKAWRSRHQPVLVSLVNALIHMYASCGVMDEAYKLFDEMPHRNTVSWSSMITGFAKQGNGEEALRVFKLMFCSNEVTPDEITFIGVLTACSHAGFISHGLQLFHSMNETFRISPQIEHFGCMVDLLSRAGLLSEALRLIGSMPMKPNNAVWGALLNGCRIHKNDEIAAHVAKQLAFGNDPNEAAGYFMLLADVHAKGRRWGEVASLRQEMLEMGVKKPAGRSWIQIDGAVHDFVAGDETHKNVILVYEMLGNINRQVRTESQNPNES